MKGFLRITTAAAALGSALFCAPANAAYVGIGVGPIGFDIYSGGYCDRWGCPNSYWTYPIFYGPVYYDNAWYRGPVYYRTVDGERLYWIHGAWHRDQWRGARPGWAREIRYGPPLGLDYYRTHGFRVRGEDWRAWQDRNYRYRAGYRDYDRGGYYGNEERYPDQDRYRNHDVDRDQYRDYDRDRYYDRDMDQERGYGPDYDRDRGTYERSGSDRDRYYGRGDENGGRGDENGPDFDRDRGYSGNDRDRDTYQRNGYEHSDYDRDRDRSAYQRTDYDRDRSSGGASGSGHMTHSTMHRTHPTHGSYHHHNMSSPPDREQGHGYMHTQYERDQGRMDQDRMHGDMDRTRPDDQTRDHGNSGPSDQNRSGSENGYEHTNYPKPSSYGHAKAPPPSGSHSPQRSKSNPDDENNGPND